MASLYEVRLLKINYCLKLKSDLRKTKRNMISNRIQNAEKNGTKGLNHAIVFEKVQSQLILHTIKGY